MASNTKNVKMGVCSIKFGGIDLGYTKGGVDVEVKTTTKIVEVDQFGQSPIDERIMGRTITAKVPMAETTLDNLVAIMPGATLVEGTAGTKATGTITLATAVPADGDTITVNGVVFTFKTTPIQGQGGMQVAVGATFAIAAANLNAAINACVDPLINGWVVSTVSTAIVMLTAIAEGVYANALLIAKNFVTSANCTLVQMSGGVDPLGRKVKVTSAIGTSLLSIAQALILHPIDNADNNRADDVTIPLAATAGDVAYAYKLDQERVWNTMFTGYPDSVTKLLFVVGDTSVSG